VLHRCPRMADADSITRCFRASDRMASWGLVLVLTPDVILRENNTSCYSRGNDRPRRRRHYTDRSIVFAGWRQYHTHPAPSNTCFLANTSPCSNRLACGLAIFAGSIRVPNTQTDRKTETYQQRNCRATSVAIGRMR